MSRNPRLLKLAQTAYEAYYEGEAAFALEGLSQVVQDDWYRVAEAIDKATRDQDAPGEGASAAVRQPAGEFLTKAEATEAFEAVADALEELATQMSDAFGHTKANLDGVHQTLEVLGKGIRELDIRLKKAGR